MIASYSLRRCPMARRRPGALTEDRAIVREFWGRVVLSRSNRQASSCVTRVSGRTMSAYGVRRVKAALSSGCKAHPATAPAGSNRSSHGGNEMAEAFD